VNNDIAVDETNPKVNMNDAFVIYVRGRNTRILAGYPGTGVSSGYPAG